MSRVSQQDLARYGHLADPNFNEQRSRQMIDDVIRRTEENYKRKQKLVADGIAERSDLIYSYIRHMDKKNKDMDITEYAGWEEMKRIWGSDRIIEMQERARTKNIPFVKYIT